MWTTRRLWAAVAAAVLCALPAPAAAGCQSQVEGWCAIGSTQYDCCSGMSCHPAIEQCYNIPRRFEQPCINGTDAKYQCGSGLSCDPVFKLCYHAPRWLDEPCSASAACKPGLTCDLKTLHCVAPETERNDDCHATHPCDSAAGLTCHPGRQECFAKPRQEDDPCTGTDNKYNATAYPCAAGTYCEVGITNECQVRGTQAWDDCHDNLPCAGNYTCHPYIRKCFHSPRDLWEPCNKNITCKAGLTCYLVPVGGQLHGWCVPQPKLWDDCNSNTACAAGFSCAPGYNKCFHNPRLAEQPCAKDADCSKGLWCDVLATLTCKRKLREGDHCYASTQCMTGMTCHPTDMKCRYSPRQEGQDCSTKTGETCAPGLFCHPVFQRCEGYAEHEEFCMAGLPCVDTLSCEDSRRVCYNVPRRWGEPCNSTAVCASGLSCDPVFPYCLP